MPLPASASHTPYSQREAEAGSPSKSATARPSNSVIVLSTLANSSPDISPWETCGDGFRGTCTAWASRATTTERLGHPTGRASSRPSVQEFSGPVGRASCQAKVTGLLSTSSLSVHQRETGPHSKISRRGTTLYSGHDNRLWV